MAKGSAKSLKHSGLGIASFVISMCAVGALIAFFYLIISTMDTFIADFGIDLSVNPDLALEILLDEARWLLAVVATLGVLIFFAPLIGLVFGIIGLATKETKKGLSLTGTIINGLFVCLFLIILISDFASNT